MVLTKDDPEVKREILSSATQVTDENSTDCPTRRLLGYYSSWHRLKKAVAWLLRIRHALKLKKDGQKVEFPKLITLDELHEAEHFVLKYTQEKAYKVLHAFRKNENVIHKDNPIWKLDPMMEDGLFCVGGRLERSQLPEKSIHPVILPGN